MTYLRSLFLNFLTVFFIVHVMPGIKVESFQNAPNIGADLLFSVIVGFLNSLIFPILVVFEAKITILRIALIAFIISFGSFIIIGVSSLPVKALTWGGAIAAAIVVLLVSVLSNFLEYKHSYHSEK